MLHQETDNALHVYLDRVMTLAQTLIIKSEYSADTLNMYLPKGTYDPNDRRTWKYYMHIAGQRHVTDKPMVVDSLDTLETIEFSIENLELHRATWRAYQYGTKYYYELLARYPNQEDLILGILYPTDIDKAITAPDHTILSYRPDMLDEQETNVIEKLQKFVFDFRDRWVNTQYRIVDDLFEATMIGVLATTIPVEIIAIQMENTHTNFANNFHIEQFLASHTYLNKYIGELTLKQKFWLYRNIRFIERNNGKTDIFEWVTQNIMTERRLPLDSFLMVHDTTEQPVDLSSTVRFDRISENGLRTLGFSDSISTQELLLKEDKLAPGNPEEREHNGEQIELTLQDSLSNSLTTKALESAMIDYSDSTPYKLSDILMNHWLYLSSLGIYRSYVRFENPTTGDIIPLNAKDAFIFSFWLLWRDIGFELDEIPNCLTAQRVQRIPLPLATDLMKVVDPKYLSIDFAKKALERAPSLYPVVSVDAFYEQVYKVYVNANYQMGLVSFEEELHARGYAAGAVERIYCTKVCPLADPGTTYAQWFEDNNIDIEHYPTSVGMEVYTQIVRGILGLDLAGVVSLKNIQASMVSIMTDLSSYSVQFLKYINDNPVENAYWSAIRIGDLDVALEQNTDIVDMSIDVVNAKDSLNQEFLMDLNPINDTFELRYEFDNEIKIDLPNPVIYRGPDQVDYYFIDTGSTTVSMEMENQGFIPPGVIPVPGIDAYLALDEIERANYPDIYGNYSPA